MSGLDKAFGPEFPNPRDDLAIRIMFAHLEHNPVLFKDAAYLASNAYLITDAMLKARQGGEA